MGTKKEIGENGLRIVSLIAENVKKLTAVEITPAGDIVTIAGKNGQGKSSILDSIWWALSGTSNIQKQPIRMGQTKARIRLDLGEIVVERRFNAAGSQLAVESGDGARFTSPQKLLDALLGELTFDPLAFTRMEPREQVDELRRVAQLDIDIDRLDGLNKSDFDRRTDINRDAKAKRAQADAIVVATGLPDQPLDETALLDRLQAAGDHNAQLEQRKARREQAATDASHLKQGSAADKQRATQAREHAEAVYKRAGEEAAAAYEKAKADAAAALKRALEAANDYDRRADSATAQAAEIQKKIQEAEALPEAVDVAAIRVELEHAKQVNAKLASRERRRQIESEAETLEKQSDQLTEQIESRKKAKADAIASAKMPIEGLGFDEGIVTFNGIPFDQASAAEQLKVSFGIARAANPKLRVILIKDGSLLDQDSLAQIADMARDGRYQVWIERVSADKKVGVFIEDGAVVAVDGKAVETEAA